MAGNAVNPRRFLAAGCFLLGVSIMTFGQQAAAPSNDKDKKDQKDKKDDKQAPAKAPAPLFGGKLGIKSSSNTKETAAMGFNGIDPSGKVDAKMLATTPSADHEAKAKQMTAMMPNAMDLSVFLQQGGLKSK